MPLGTRPRLVNLGLAEHGRSGAERYELPKLWCLHLYFYRVELVAGGGTYEVVPGAVTLVPPGTQLVYKYAGGRHRHFFVHFALGSRAPRISVPLLQHVPDGRDELLDRLQNIQRVLADNPLHAETLFWGVLWDLAESGRKPPGKLGKGTSFKAIDAFIEKHLPQKLTVVDVAENFRLTATQINRIVRSRSGMTTVQLIKRSRLQRAYRLLLHSTMPIKVIAAECGIADLQQFNKLMRASYGKSPRRLREQILRTRKPTWAMERE